MKKIKRLLFLFLLLSSAVNAWQFDSVRDIPGSASAILVLDPDFYGRTELAELKKMGAKPIAWLNIGEIEEWRTVAADFKLKNYAFQKRKSSNGLKLAVFYSDEFGQIAEERVREYLMKGFSGILFANVDFYSQVSNSPINRSEMWRLIEHLAGKARSLNLNSCNLILDGNVYIREVADSKVIDGVVITGLFNGEKGRHVHEWERQARLKQLGPLFSRKKSVFTVEMANKAHRIDFIERECKKLGIDYCIENLPLQMKRRLNNGLKK
ncbi:MAG: hypothetical protein Kow0029_29630 [Candidatus Rifleibacteriota bacterium]